MTPNRFNPALRWLITHSFIVIALVVLLFNFSVYIIYGVNLIQFPFDYDQGEGFELVDVILFSQGQFPYRDTDHYPFYSSNYPPLFHIFPLPFMWMFGAQYWYGRLLSFVAVMIGAGVIGLAVHRTVPNRWIALCAGLAFLSSNTIYHISPLFRQHMTMVVFEIIAISVLAWASQHPKQTLWRYGLGLGLLIMAGYTKQLAAFSALGALVFLFIRNPRRGILLGMGFAVVGLGIFAWLNWATDGQWFQQAIAANVNDYYAQQTVGLFRLWFRLHRFLIIPTLLYIAYELYFTRLSVYSIWFIFSLINGMASGGWGAGDSYFATSIAEMCVLSGLFFARLLHNQWEIAPNHRWMAWIKPITTRATPSLVAMIASVVVPLCYIGYGLNTLKMPTNLPVYETVAHWLRITPNAPAHVGEKTFYDSAGRIAGGYADIGHFTTPADVEAGWRLVELIQASDKPVITEDAGFNIVAGREVITNPTQLRNLAHNDLFDDTELIQMIEQQEFGAIIFRAQFYPPSVLQAIHEAYEPNESESVMMNGFKYIIMRPRTD